MLSLKKVKNHGLATIPRAGFQEQLQDQVCYGNCWLYEHNFTAFLCFSKSLSASDLFSSGLSTSSHGVLEKPREKYVLVSGKIHKIHLTK